MVFCNAEGMNVNVNVENVTILILVDGFLQYYSWVQTQKLVKSHNPYFSRWFSAIPTSTEYGIYETLVTILILVDGFLQY